MKNQEIGSTHKSAGALGSNPRNSFNWDDFISVDIHKRFMMICLDDDGNNLNSNANRRAVCLSKTSPGDELTTPRGVVHTGTTPDIRPRSRKAFRRNCRSSHLAETP